MKIGITELIVILIVVLLVVGPDRLPGFAKKMGEAVTQFRKYSEDATREIKESIVEPLEEAQAPLREAVKPLEDLNKAVRDNAKELKGSFEGIGKQKKSVPAHELEDVEEPKALEEPEDVKEPEDIEEAKAEAPTGDSPSQGTPA